MTKHGVNEFAVFQTAKPLYYRCVDIYLSP